MGIDGANALRVMVRNDNTDEKLLKVEFFSDGHWKLGWYQSSYIREVPGKKNYEGVANAIQTLLKRRY